jgi:hypothetical protein
VSTLPLPVPPSPEGYVLNTAPPPAAPPPLDVSPPPPEGYVLNAPAQPVGTAEDVAKSARAGLVTGAAGIPGMIGDAQAFLSRPFDWLARKYEAYDPDTARANRALADRVGRASDIGEARLPTTARIEQMTGTTPWAQYEPTTEVGKYTRSIAEMAPGALLGPTRSVVDIAGNLARFAVAPGVAGQAASNAADRFLPGSGAAPYARAAASILAPSIGPRLIAPAPAEAAHAAQAAALRDEGVTALTAGQRTGSKKLSHFEDAAANIPFSGRDPATMNMQAAEQFTNAALRRVGEHGPPEAPNRATPEVIDRAYTRIGNDLDRLSANNRMQGTRALGVDLQDAEREYQSLVPESARAPIVADTIREIGEGVANNGGSLPGETYQALRSRLSRAARNTNDPQLSHALSGMTEAMDDAIARSIRANNPADIGGFEQARRQYRNMLVIERAAAGAGEDAAKGLLSPALLSSAAKQVMGKRAFARGQGDFEPLARAGQAVLRPLPNSGTAQRAEALHYLQLAGLLGAGGEAAHALTGSLLGGAVGLAAPAVMARGLLSAPVQNFAGNQLLAGLPRARDTAQGQYIRLRGLLDAAGDGEGRP